MRPRWLAALLLGSVAVGACRDEEPKGPLPDYIADPDLYAAEPSAFVELEPGGTRVGANIVVVQLNEGETHETAVALAEGMGGSIVGRHPNLRAYQIDVGTTTLAALDEKIAVAEADPAVSSAGYDVEITYLAKDFSVCPVKSDNEVNLKDEVRCPFDNTKWYKANTIFEKVKGDLTLGDPIIGVVDTSFWLRHPEFVGIEVIDAHQDYGAPGTLLEQQYENGKRDSHGTDVLGILAADTDEVATNGMWTPFAKKRRVALAASHNNSFHGMIGTQAVINAGARVVNMSWGLSCKPDVEKGCRNAHGLWNTLRVGNPNVLFVVAVPHDPGFPDGFGPGKTIPADGRADNMLNVGDAQACQTLLLHKSIGPGPIDIVAQGHNYPLLKIDDPSSFSQGFGSSFAAPQVTALAATLLTIAPKLSAKELHDYILDNALPGPLTPGGENTLYLDFGLPLIDVLLDHGDLQQESRELLRSGEDGAIRVGPTVARICGLISYKVGDLPEEEVAGTDLLREELGGKSAFGGIPGPGLGWSLASISSTSSLAAAQSSGDFTLGEHPVGDMSEGLAGITYFRGEKEFGNSTSGVVKFDSCEIIERFPASEYTADSPWVVLVQGSLTATLEYIIIQDTGGTINEERRVDGTFELPFLVNAGGLVLDPASVAYLESKCVGGKTYG